MHCPANCRLAIVDVSVFATRFFDFETVGLQGAQNPNVAAFAEKVLESVVRIIIRYRYASNRAVIRSRAPISE